MTKKQSLYLSSLALALFGVLLTLGTLSLFGPESPGGYLLLAFEWTVVGIPALVLAGLGLFSRREGDTGRERRLSGGEMFFAVIFFLAALFLVYWYGF